MRDEKELIRKMGTALAGANRLSMGPSQETYDNIMVKIVQALTDFREWEKEQPK